ncbi:putative mediator of RNA polymerase II transcription subunit 26 [Drosophila santomea]|uniref:putative mediator of RNA polymerase II transcription subunit 26 n=1 Tax=Drosophila santomea TaxID=129105 RepID=UPI001CC9C0FF|nr:putative mediator of RNA polymerase II transcription subunit 26 [Drosophila santomea]
METLPCANQLQEHQQPQQQHVNLTIDPSLGENVVSIPKELILISLVSQEQSLYNPKHPNYRSTKTKDEKWLEIGSNVGWSDVQCKSKWKAMRDQYCRELKRAKACAKAVKWKYFKELDFLRPYALARNYRGRSGQTTNGVVGTVAPLTLPMTTSFSSNSSSQNLNLSGSIKIEDASASTLLDSCSFSSASSADKKPAATFLASHIGAVLQQQQHQQQQQEMHSQPESNWNYLTDAGGGATPSIIVQCGTANTTTVVDTLYNEIVDCVNAANQSSSAATITSTVSTTSAAHNQSANAEEEDDDPIHTFLNMESYFEKELIALIQQEDMIYNYGNENYRNAKLKMEVWEEIARKLKKSVKQCRLKWKALRDQYAREHKRLRTLMHIDATSRWKHYDSLSFLQKYIQQKTLESDSQLSMLLPKNDPVRELEEQMAHSHSPPTQQSTIESSSSSSQLNMPTLPHLTGPHKAEQQQQQQEEQHQQQQQQQASDLCVATYDDMDIENYINGDVHHDDDVEDDEDEEMETTAEQAPQQQDQHVMTYDHEDGPVYMAVPSVGSTMSKQEQLSDGATSLENQQLQSTGEYQKMEIQTPTTPRYQNAATTPSSTSTSRYHSAPITPSKPSHMEFPSSNGHNCAEDDEIGAFFKAVSMKIRNAQLEPVAFTELQIEILRVINEALRNH